MTPEPGVDAGAGAADGVDAGLGAGSGAGAGSDGNRSRLVVAGLAALLLSGVALCALVHLRMPWVAGDYLAGWGIRGRALARTGDLLSLARVSLPGPAGAYPPLWPLVLAGFARLTGGYDELNLTLLFPLLCLLAALFACQATAAPLPGRLLAGAAVALLPYYRTPVYGGYAEALLVVFLLAAFSEVDRLESDRWAIWRMSLFLVLATLTKREGFLVALFFAFALAFARRFRDASVAGLATIGLGFLPWGVFFRIAKVPLERDDFRLAAFDLSKLGLVGGYLLEHVLLPKGLWLLGAVAILALSPVTRRRRRAVLLSVASYAAILFVSMAFTLQPAVWHVHWSWDRLVLVPIVFLIPVLAECVSEQLSPPSEPA